MTTLPGGAGTAILVRTGETLRIVNTHGTQTVDFWGLAASDPAECVSVEQTRRMLYNLYPGLGDHLYSNRRRPLLHITEDTAEGHHDTLFDCCDEWVYRDYGAPDGHPNCRTNFATAIEHYGLAARDALRPLNLWMNVTVSPDGRIHFDRPRTQPGDHVDLLALTDLVIILSACPMDVTPVNGGDGTPRDVEWILNPSPKL